MILTRGTGGIEAKNTPGQSMGKSVKASYVELNLATAEFEENSNEGIMICGINWGGDPQSESLRDRPSFFSDATVNNFPYRNRLLKWFHSWGHALQTEPGKEGAFERAIAQTNWLRGQSKSMHGADIIQECVNGKDNLFDHIRQLRPRVILFSGTTLIRALNDHRCSEAAIKCLGGRGGELQWKTKDIALNGKRLKKFRVGFQSFERCAVIAVPHPTGSKGLSDEYIAAFKDDISPVIDSFRSGNR